MIRFEKMNEKVKVALEKYNNSAKDVSDFEEVQSVFKEYAENVFEIEKEMGVTALTGMDGKFFCENLFTNIAESVYNIINEVNDYAISENKESVGVIRAEDIFIRPTSFDNNCKIPSTMQSQGIYFYSIFFKSFVNEEETDKIMAVDFFVAEDGTVTYDVRSENGVTEYQEIAADFEEDFQSDVENGVIEADKVKSAYDFYAKNIYTSKNIEDLDYLHNRTSYFISLTSIDIEY